MAAAQTQQAPFLAIQIHVEHCHLPEHGRRCWEICVQGLPAPHSDTHTVKLFDPFSQQAYDNYELWLRDTVDPSLSKSLQEHPSSWMHFVPRAVPQLGLTAETETASVISFTVSHTPSLASNPLQDGRARQHARHPSTHDEEQAEALSSDHEPSISDYREKLALALGLNTDSLKSYSRIKVYVCEEVHVGPQDPGRPSIHALMWELLEPYDSKLAIEDEEAAETPAPEKQAPRQEVEVHRIFTGVKEPIPLTPGLRMPEAPIRLLLVISRGLQVNVENRFVDIQSVVHDTLCSLRKYLRSCGHHGRIQIDVVRPGTYHELEKHLEKDNKYDVVHLDVHGRAEGMDDTPELLFSQPGLCTAPPRERVSYDESVFQIVKAEAVAQLLAKHRIPAVLLSACLSSWAQRRPFDNMCRVFASHGIRIVTGISFTAWSDKVEAYYADFYPALVLANYGFRRAALHGRLSLHRRLINDHEWMEKEESERRERKRRHRRSRKQAKTKKSGSFWEHQIGLALINKFFSASNHLFRHSQRSSQQTRQTQQDTQKIKHTFPTVTTYYGYAGNLFDRKNSDLLGVDIDRTLIQKPANFLSRFWSRHPHIWVTLLPFLRMVLPPSMVNPSDHLTAFERFRARPENRNRLHSVGLMALEDRLKSLNTLYIHLCASPTRPQLLRGVRESWLATKFAARVDIVSASVFKWSVMYFLLHLSSLFRSFRTWWQPENRESVRVGRTVLVIDKIDNIFRKGVTQDKVAVERMKRYVEAAEEQAKHGLYIIFMSVDDVDWKDLDLNPDDFPWVTARKFVANAGLLVFREPGSS
ncbi:hypothetical protein QBC47DRAFT_395869 [Echria macrotheca]|uniref:CHAT domain-containing protein n=1 Tax=Echria macrotheca TaxID=438768 RepID=A0AAJ0F0Y3_9PEZI|nr:hypothetical protein QBC47DRAFT_395869 [Echria macrotheca]